MDNEVYSRLVCALTHNLDVCDKCRKCGDNSADIRMALISTIAKENNKELPWEEDSDD